MDPTTGIDVTGTITGLTVYGPMGICLVYFMVKDWIKSSQTNAQMLQIAAALEKVAANMEMCNRRV